MFLPWMFQQTVFAVVPLIAIIAYIPGLFSSSATAGQRVIHVICILSLTATAYIMQSSSFSASKDSFRPILATSDRDTWSSKALSGENRQYLVLVNSVLCAILALASRYTVDTVLCLLPGGKRIPCKESNRYQTLNRATCAAFLAITSLARRVITEVDVGELEKLRYEYKGA